MDPITLSLLIGGGASIFGGMQAGATNEQNNRNALLNYYAQQQAQQRAEGEARRQQLEAKQGSVDAQGNRVEFVPGRGWVTSLSGDQQQISDASEDEQLRQLIEGGARAERVDARANVDRNAEDTMAQAAMDELRGVRPSDTGRLRELYLARGAETRNRSADRAGDVTARQGLRAGGGYDAAELMSQARGQSDQTQARQAGVDATMQAEQEGERQFDHSRDRASNLYDYFRRASTSGTMAPQGYTPTGPQRSSTGVADQGLINTLGRAPQQEYNAPNLAMSDTAQDIGTLFNAYGQNKRNDELMGYFKQRWGTNAGAI